MAMSSEELGFKDHFSALAAGYSRFRPGYPQGLFEYLGTLTPAHELVWDCATGSGQAALALADLFAQVIATDASSEQIGQASPHPSITYRVAPAEASGLEAASVDLITVAQALHWFDIPRFMQEAQRVLRPKGILAVWTYNLFRITPQIDAIVDELYWDVLDGHWAEERKLVDRGYADLEMPFRELSPPRFNMGARWPLQLVLGYLGTWSAVRSFKEKTGNDPLAEIAKRLQQAWGEAGLAREIVWPLSLRVCVNE